MEYIVTYEIHLPRGWKNEADALIDDQWADHPHLIQPNYRVLALDGVGTDQRVVANQSVFMLEEIVTGRIIRGLGDLVVAEPYRGRGIARMLIDTAMWAIPATDPILTSTRNLGMLFTEKLGFVKLATGVVTWGDGKVNDHLYLRPGKLPLPEVMVLKEGRF